MTWQKLSHVNHAFGTYIHNLCFKSHLDILDFIYFCFIELLLLHLEESSFIKLVKYWMRPEHKLSWDTPPHHCKLTLLIFFCQLLLGFLDTYLYLLFEVLLPLLLRCNIFPEWDNCVGCFRPSGRPTPTSGSGGGRYGWWLLCVFFATEPIHCCFYCCSCEVMSSGLEREGGGCFNNICKRVILLRQEYQQVQGQEQITQLVEGWEEVSHPRTKKKGARLVKIGQQGKVPSTSSN